MGGQGVKSPKRNQLFGLLTWGRRRNCTKTRLKGPWGKTKNRDPGA